MYHDLQCDFNRYIDFHGYKDNLTVWKKIYVFFNSPGFFAIAIYRFGFLTNDRINTNKKCLVWYVLNLIYLVGRFLSVVLFKVGIYEGAEIEPGLFISNKGNIILGVKRAGKCCTIHERVTIGMGIGIGSRRFSEIGDNAFSEIGDNVLIGADSLLYGKIKIGSHTIIKESTVLSKSIPERCLVSGNPGHIIKRNFEL